MTVSFSTFDRLKSKGVAAYKNGEYLTAVQLGGNTVLETT